MKEEWKEWTALELSDLIRSYQGACILAAAAELDLFTLFAKGNFTAIEAAGKTGADTRAMTVLLDALAAMKLLLKDNEHYSVPESVSRTLSDGRPGSQLAMAQHQANCMRRWAQLAEVVKTGKPVCRVPSIRGAAGDQQSFIEAMDNISAPMADGLIGEVQPLRFSHVLDVGGASGTWTLAFLRANPAARATIFDLADVIPQARERISKAGFADRVNFVSGDFSRDALPAGADLAWVSAIVHQNSREQNRDLFGKIHAALERGGQILIRDIVMQESRTEPVAGALFAINMLVGTPLGTTFTFNELREDLHASGFDKARMLRHDEGMHSIVWAGKE